MIQVAIKSEYIIKVIGLEKPISSFTLLEDGVNIYGISHIEWQNNGNVYFYLKNALQLGKHYQLIVNEECYEVDLTNFVDLDFFDKTYFYDGELGAIYEPNMTSFKLFAPLAYQVNVILYKNKKEEIYPMTRLRCGVFVGQISGDLDNVSYLYEIHQNGKIIRTLDPYSLSVTLNKEYSVVINKNSYTMEKYNLPVMNQYVDAIIYETSIRDLTTYAKSPIKHKGTYYGFVEENRKYRDVPIGIDLLKFLNITHVQVLPINAFFGIDENNVQKQYNWGYNPILYMALEGSYSINPASPQMRIKEFKFLVSTLHKAGIRINIDVVFNHIYKYETSIYQQIVPNYYFRHNASSFSNGSFCGNDLDTCRPMVRKLILDTLKFFVEFYDVDGFRFDLLGIIDIETSKIIERELRVLKKDIMLYGEGWNMPTFLEDTNKSTIDNAKKLPTFAFFSDYFRDIAKGSSFGKLERGYLLGARHLREDFIKAFKGMYRDNKFLSPNQCINYLECHDNYTLFDKLSYVFQNKENIVLKQLKLNNALNILACGIPFIHMGQEVGLTKFGEGNTYNMLDKYNQYDYDILEKRKDLLSYMRDIIKIRKQYHCFCLDDYIKINDTITFENLDNNGLKINYKFNNKILSVLFNISENESIYYGFKDTQRVIFNEAGMIKDNLYVQSLILSPLNLVIVIED